MEDNKRLIIALVLSAALMLAYSVFTGDQKPQNTAQVAKETEKSVDTRVVEKERKTVKGKAVAERSAEARKEATVTSAGDVVVETPLYKAWINLRGGGLRKVVLRKYKQELDGKNGGFVLLDMGKGEEHSLAFNLPPYLKTLDNRIFDCEKEKIRVGENEEGKELQLKAVESGLEIIKVYRFNGKSYGFELEIKVKNTGDGVKEINPEISMVERASAAGANTYAFTGVELWNNQQLVELDAGDLEENPKETGVIEWATMSIPYFMGAVAPLNKTDEKKRYARGSLEKGIMKVVVGEPGPVELKPGQETSVKYLVYYGPRELEMLEPLGHDLDRSVDYGWFDIIARPMLVALKFFYSFTGNYGIAIILITILVKILFWPLTAKSYKSMKKMQKLQPQIMKLREKYKDDKQKMNAEIMQMYKTYKVNPMGGCLPMVVQIPVFIAFYKVLGVSIELRHAPFLLWINDLSAPDRLPIGFEIPFVGNGLPVLTLLMGASMFIQQKMTPTTGDPTQAKMMMLMPVVFTVMFINFPSGLVLYWLTNNLLSIGQQYMTNKRK